MSDKAKKAQEREADEAEQAEAGQAEEGETQAEALEAEEAGTQPEAAETSELKAEGAEPSEAQADAEASEAEDDEAKAEAAQKPEATEEDAQEPQGAGKEPKAKAKEAQESEAKAAKEPEQEEPKGHLPVEPAPYSGNQDPTGGEGSFMLSSWLFLRILGVVYLAAFASAWVQIIGLVGEQGILPIARQMEWIASRKGGFWSSPSLLWWLSASDSSLHLLCGAGVLASICVTLGLCVLPMLVLLWLAYLSVAQAGQIFFFYQWDTLLLEVGFLAIFLAGWRWWSRVDRLEEPPLLVVWMFRWLLFRLMFFSGYVKLASGDVTWRKLTALQYHYWTQPLPSWISWYFHQLPAWFHQTSVALTLALELLVPFAILATRLPRALAGFALIGLQVMIALTGNYGFFNLLSAALCLFLIDDAILRGLLPGRLAEKIPIPIESPRDAQALWPLRLGLMALALPLLFGLSLMVEGQRFQRYAKKSPKPPASSSIRKKINYVVSVPVKWFLRGLSDRDKPKAFRKWYWRARRLHLVNRYGLFASMTRRRPEILLEGSLDGKVWKAYRFKWKPGDPKRPPSLAGLHMPRLDWQMWFAALYNNPRRWVRIFGRRLMEGKQPVLELLERNPFPAQPPRYIRARRYRYTFTDPATREKTGAWWHRVERRMYFPPMRK